MSHRLLTFRRRQVLALIAALPFSASAQTRLAPRRSGRLLKSGAEAAVAALWPERDVTIHLVQAGAGIATFASGTEVPDAASLEALADVLRPAETAPLYVAVYGPNPRVTARTILGALLYTDLRPPLQLHLAFVGRRDFGEALGQQIRPALAEYVVLDLDEPAAG